MLTIFMGVPSFSAPVEIPSARSWLPTVCDSRVDLGPELNLGLGREEKQMFSKARPTPTQGSHHR